jgi:hypothetical protein
MGGTDAPVVWKIILALVRPFLMTPTQGARTSLYVASSGELARVTGKYFAKAKEVEPSPQSRDPKLMGATWLWTEKMIGQQVTGSYISGGS